MPNLVQFNSNKVLFHGDKTCFSATASPCGCTASTDPTPPDPTLNTCASCASTELCGYLAANLCTPTRLKLTLTDPTFQTSCQTCSGDGKSVRVTAGTIAGDKVLEQDPFNSCRWYLTDVSPTVVVAGFNSNNCTSTETDATQIEYSVTQNAADFTVRVVARFDLIKGAEFVLFSGNYPGLLTDSLAVALAGDSGFSFECFDYTERSGGRLGQGGTAAIGLCPTITICHCTDSPTCLVLTPVASLPPGDADWTYDSTVEGVSIQLPRTNVCEWFTGTVSGFGVTNLQAKVKWYDTGDTQATEGCGYYLYLYAYDGVNAVLKGAYYRSNEDASGVYNLFDDVISGMPRTVVVSMDCAVPFDCTAFAGWPLAITVDILDGNHDSTHNITGTYVMTRTVGSDTYFADLPTGGSDELQLTCISSPFDGWDLNIFIGCNTFYRKPTEVGGRPVSGQYYYAGGGCSIYGEPYDTCYIFVH
jgi:hypothetical protein